MSKLVIAIDGPAGAGKSTVAKRLAKELGLRFLDTGAMYRALALKAMRRGLAVGQEVELTSLSENTLIEFGSGDPQCILLDGENVSALIRTPEIGEMASAISVFSGVRRVMAAQQRRIVEAGGVTLEGRDTTTVTAFDAPIRIYLTASLDVRARRRFEELQLARVVITLDEIKEQIAERDFRDMNRPDSPLQIAEGVTVIESDDLSIDEVVAKIAAMAR